MSTLDQFESAFKSASKAVYQYVPRRFARVLAVTDLAAHETRLFRDRVRAFLDGTAATEGAEWLEADREVGDTLGALMERVEATRPDLICTYRNLHSGAWRWPYTLGDHLEVLTQVTSTPVMALPRLDDEEAWTQGVANTDRVMAMTDQLTGDDPLVNWAVACTLPGGGLYLTHVEGARDFERFIDAIGKIPSIDTGEARVLIQRQLLKEPSDYIDSCRAALAEARPALTVEARVELGHHLRRHRELAIEHEVDLLVVNTKDADQLAMRGQAHALAVELRNVPILML